MAIPYLACMIWVAQFNALPPRVLPVIASVEGGRVGSVHRNTDGSEDLGVMQVNTRWIPPLVTYVGRPAGEIRDRLMNDACFNIAAAGAILRVYLNETRGDLMLAIGNYHSHTPTLNQAYQQLVTGAAWRMFPAHATPPSVRR